ncbi:MAG TPA: C45 family peptidase [Candidatus Bathyarchaeia archaeon]|nr:C45 family peptidase [Candidatus Bathyarchaeia archaeon]
MRQKLPVLALAGSPYKKGFKHGKQAQSEIKNNLETYFRRFKSETELTHALAVDRAAKLLEVINRVSPEYAETMKGVAAGSGQELLDITALNVRYELMYSQFSKIGLKPIPKTFGCTAFAALPEAIDNGHLIMAQNWDWIPELKGVFLKERSTNAPDVLSFTEAGVVGGKIGLNSEGLGLLINGIVSSKDDWARLKKPFHVRCWEVLRSKTLGKATRIISQGQRNCSANFILGQQKRVGLGKVVDIESAPEAVCEIGPDRGAVAHTNHFSNPKILGVKQVVDEERLSTLQRYRRIQKLLDGTVRTGKKLDLVAAQNMLRDHQGSPESVCRHTNLNLPEYQRYETVVSVVMDLYSKRLWATSGTPCSNEYESIKL